MNVDVDVNLNRFTGTQKLVYTNNSPDILNKVFYHLYWNAFQPNSMMDARSRELGKILVGGKPIALAQQISYSIRFDTELIRTIDTQCLL